MSAMHWEIRGLAEHIVHEHLKWRQRGTPLSFRGMLSWVSPTNTMEGLAQSAGLTPEQARAELEAAVRVAAAAAGVEVAS